MFRSFSSDTYLIVGRTSKGLRLHGHDVAWVIMLAGTYKMWFVAPPGGVPPPLKPNSHYSVAELKRTAGVEQCVQKVGEVIFVPKSWWCTYASKTR